jgi:hypothetical protein
MNCLGTVPAYNKPEGECVWVWDGKYFYEDCENCAWWWGERIPEVCPHCGKKIKVEDGE